MKSLWIIMFSLLLSACSVSIPKEVVELSYKMDKDMTHVEQAYMDLVRQHIAVLKKQREDYLYNEWVPALLEDWIVEGMLIEMAQGKVVYSISQKIFQSTEIGMMGLTLFAMAVALRGWNILSIVTIRRPLIIVGMYCESSCHSMV
ncbi:hypothetical protein [Vibrio harveyi]|uniref:hypothetical protein n=1 Tax=Vibrio harveyi TaxID=669 RepID=UPI003BB7729C|nr:hypothetical protein [Vibrio harveyi]